MVADHSSTSTLFDILCDLRGLRLAALHCFTSSGTANNTSIYYLLHILCYRELIAWEGCLECSISLIVHVTPSEYCR